MASVADEVDHITYLPDAIIHYVFSFLPFKDVVKTSLLSKQWRFAWTFTPYIDLSLPLEDVAPSIDRALSLYRATKVEKFHLDAAMSGLYIPTELDRWFRFATAHKVEDASLGFGHRYHIAPRFLCNCASLVSLRVSKCLFSWDITTHWPSLKKLCLHDVPLDDDKLIKILSGCPVLESLTLSFSPVTCNLRIDSRSLRELVIESVCISSLEVSAPNLLSLHWSGEFFFGGFRLNGASSLAEAELNFKKPTDFLGSFSDQLKFILEQMQHVAKITIGSWCLEILSATKVKGMSYLSSRWRNITMYTTVCKREVLGMVYLLQSSPLLERLVICNPKSNEFTWKPYMDFQGLSNLDEKHFWRRAKECYGGANHLKRVTIVGFQFDYVRSKPLLALAKFLLEKAVGLEKMVIDAELRKSYRGVPIYPHDLIQLQKGCRRFSRNAEVIVNYGFNGLAYVL